MRRRKLGQIKEKVVGTKGLSTGDQSASRFERSHVDVLLQGQR